MFRGPPGFAVPATRPYSPSCMQKHRPFLTALLGLTLWVQGLAIAAAPGTMAAQAADAAMAASADPAPAASLETPCHGDEPAPAVSPCDCCDGDCANMTGCVVGSFAAAPAAAMQAEAPPYIVIAARPWPPQTAVPLLPLRPPIVFHA